MSQTCPYCRDEITSGAESFACPTCSTPHHPDCWNENGGCTVFGCASGPEDDPKLSLSQETQQPPFLPPARPFLPPRVPLPSRPTPVPPIAHYAPVTPAAIPQEISHIQPPDYVQRERPLLKDMLFMGFVGMPLGALAGALLGLAFGILAIPGSGLAAFFNFPAYGLHYGQAFGAILGIAAALVRGRGFVATKRGQVQTFVRFIFGNSSDPCRESESDAPKEPRI
jgi:hypothetical protein